MRSGTGRKRGGLEKKAGRFFRAAGRAGGGDGQEGRRFWNGADGDAGRDFGGNQGKLRRLESGLSAQDAFRYIWGLLFA